MKQLQENLLNLFGSYKDFPKPGIIFCDILPVLRNPEVFADLIINMSESKGINNSDALVAIDARGFIFGTAICQHLKKPLICARKPGKLPGEILTESYKLEYGENTLCIQKESIKKYKSFSIVDDLLATGGTAACVEKMLLEEGKSVNELSVVVELQELNGKGKLACKVNSQIIL